MAKVAVATLLIPEEPLQVLPTLAASIGVNEAIFLQQVHYWLRCSRNEANGRKWIYNTHREWLDQMPWMSESTLKRAIKSLLDLGLLWIRQDGRRTWYTIDYEALISLREKGLHRYEPGQNEPGQNEPGQNEPGQNEPGQNEPGQNEPGQNEPLIRVKMNRVAGQNEPDQPPISLYIPHQERSNMVVVVDKDIDIPSTTIHHTREGQRAKRDDDAGNDGGVVVRGGGCSILALDLIKQHFNGWNNAAAYVLALDDKATWTLLTWLWVEKLLSAKAPAAEGDPSALLQFLEDKREVEQAYTPLFAGVANKIGLIRGHVKSGYAAPLLDVDERGLKEAVEGVQDG